MDSQFNTKLADLELGVPSYKTDQGNSSEPSYRSNGPTIDDFLVNWVAPEVF